MIDRDTRSENEIAKLRALDSDFFDQHIMFLPVHEVENFLLDENSIAEILNKFLNDFSPKHVEASEIVTIMKECADSILDNTRKKYLNNELHEIIKSISGIVKQRDINAGDETEYIAYVNGLLTEQNIQSYVAKMEGAFSKMQVKYSDDNWAEQWKVLCDGKMVLDKTCGKLENIYHMDRFVLKAKLSKLVLSNKQSYLMQFWKSLSQRFV